MVMFLDILTLNKFMHYFFYTSFYKFHEIIDNFKRKNKINTIGYYNKNKICI